MTVSSAKLARLKSPSAPVTQAAYITARTPVTS
jgi:hypothetical protein